MSKKIIYYYQTFTGLESILQDNSPVTHVHLSAIHFGIEDDGVPYIHLNNFSPNYSKYDKVWIDVKKAQDLGIKVILMVGGAGSAYNTLFSNYQIYYPMLVEVIRKYNLDGIDLDIEEPVSLNNVKKLINNIDSDFGLDFSISMAPIQSAVQYNINGLGAFNYKELYNSPEGGRIDYFNVQFYNNYSESAYDMVINNDYAPEKIVMGMYSYQNFQNNLDTVKNLCSKYINFGGVYNWEFFTSPPESPSDPGNWAYLMKEAMKNEPYFTNCILS